MCGRVIQSSSPLRLAIVEGLDISDGRMGNVPAPSQELLVIRENHKTGERSLELIKWGLIPHWCAYMCEKDSVSAGMRAAKNETHP
jgi:putative SOS response-associated peptidase YedK